jgi:hypothetical protein
MNVQSGWECKMTDVKTVIASILVGLVSGSAVTYSFFPEVKTPCIYNFSETWLYYMEQSELNDIDETEAQKQFHDMIVTVLKDQDNLYVDKHGREYVVPGYCYVEDTGLFVKLWKKND